MSAVSLCSLQGLAIGQGMGVRVRLTRRAANQGFPGGAHGKDPAPQCRRRKRFRFNSWVRKIPWRRAWQLTPVFLENPMDRGAWWATVPGVPEPDRTEATLHTGS